MNTPKAINEPERAITLVMHPVEAHYLLRALSLLSKEPHHFDCGANTEDYRELHTAIAEARKEGDPHDAAMLADPNDDKEFWPIYPSPPFYPKPPHDPEEAERLLISIKEIERELARPGSSPRYHRATNLGDGYAALCRRYTNLTGKSIRPQIRG